MLSDTELSIISHIYGMNYLSTFTFFYILSSSSILFFLPSVNGDCSYSSCAADTYPGNQITFPFRAPDQPNTCGLPGFDLGCNYSTRTPLLTFPSGQSFTVGMFFNDLDEIVISDPQGCLPEKLVQNSNTWGTPFHFNYFTNYSLHSCPSRNQLPHYNNSYTSCAWIPCGGGPPYSALCETTNSSLLNDACEFIRVVRVPGFWNTVFEFTNIHAIALYWELPGACLRCKGKCQRSRKDFTQIKCNVFTPGAIAGITIAVIVVIAVTISCILCKCRRRISQSVTIEGLGGGATSTSTTASATNIRQATLDAYPTIVVGESGRLLMTMEDKTCPICLSDYKSKDTLKSLPECLHRFHADCIDEWLRSKPTCPICRTLPQFSS